MKSISQMLSLAVDSDGQIAWGWTREEVVELYTRAIIEFKESPIGQELLRRGGQDFIDRAVEICSERFENTSPMLTPYYETLEAVGKDILTDCPPEPVAPKTPTIAETIQIEKAAAAAALVEQERKESERRERAKQDGILQHFADKVNEQLNRNPDPARGVRGGVESLKPRNGTVTLDVTKGHFTYSAGEFDELFAKCQAKGLIR